MQPRPSPPPAPPPDEQTPRRKPARKRLVLLALAAVAAAGLVLAWLFLPGAGLRWGVVELLRRAGMQEVSLAGGEFSLFGKRIVIQGMAANPKQGRPLHLDDLTLLFHWKPLFDRRVSVEAVSLKGLAISVRHQDGRYLVNGLPLGLPGGAPAGKAGQGETGGGQPWLFGVDALQLADSRMHFTDGGREAELAIAKLSIDNLRGWDPETPARFHLEGTLDGAPLTLDGTATPFARHPQFAVKVTARGLDLTTAGLVERLTGLAGLTGRVDAELAVTGQPDQGKTGADGRLTLHDLAWNGGGRRFTAATLAWSGKAGFPAAAGGAASLDGTAEADAARLALPGSETTARHLRLQGKVELTDEKQGKGGGPAGGLPLRGRLAAQIDGLALGLPGQGMEWLAADHAEAAALSLAPDAPVVAEGLTLTGAAALQRRADKGGYPWRLLARQARADRLSWSDAGAGAVAIGDLQLDGAQLRLVRTAEGWLGFSDVAGGSDGGEPMRLSLGKLAVGNQSGGLFVDRTMRDPVTLRLDGLEGSLERLDTGAAEQDSPFTVKARVEGAPLAAHGSVRLFGQSLSGQLEGDVRGLELPPLSAYAAAGLGVHVQTGHLDARLTASLKNRRLDGRMALTLAKLFIAPPDPKAPIAQKTDLPMDTVLDLLRDRDGVIHLEIPISGAVDAPDLDVSDAVNQAVAGALRATAATTLQVLFPVAALINLVGDDGEGRHLALAPLPFDPGQDALTDEHRARLEGVAKLLRERPGLKLTLCGVASAERDWPPLVERRRKAQADMLSKLKGMLGVSPGEPPPPDQAALSRLAERRGLAVKAALADSFGIDAGRLFSCRPRVETAPAKGGPRVDLLL